MIKVLNGFNWLEDLDGTTKEIDECLEKGLLKYTDDESRPQFIMIESNESAVKEILKGDYNKLQEKDFIEWLEFDFGGGYDDLKIENIYGDKVRVSIDMIIDLIKDEDVEWISNDKKLEVYNAECPFREMFDILNELGREQAKFQIQDLLNNIMNQTFR